MNTIKQSNISIDQGETERISNRRHARLSLLVSEGTAWVTIAGDPVDYLLKAGERLELTEDNEDLVVESLSKHLELQVLVA